jgi:transposase-like protein
MLSTMKAPRDATAIPGTLPEVSRPVSAGKRSRSPTRKRPDAATLHQLYVEQDRPLAELTARYRVGAKTARGWLLEAGIPIRTKAQGGRRRHLRPPPPEELRELAEREMNVAAVARILGVSSGTATRWLTEANIALPHASSNNRPRGQSRPVTPPSEDLLRLYVTDQLAIATVAERLQLSAHLVRKWLLEAGVVLRPPGGRPGTPHVLPPRKPPPPAEELRRLWIQEQLTHKQLAAQFGVHPQTASRWLADIGLAGPRPLPVPAPELVQMYQQQEVTAAQIARQVGVPVGRVLKVLHDAGVQIDPARQAAAVRTAAATRPKAPALPPSEGDWAEHQYRQGWAYSLIAGALGRPHCAVRRELHDRGLATAQPLLPGRGSRVQAPADAVEELYVEEGMSAQQVGQALGLPGGVVLRTGHAHGMPIRQGGTPRVPIELCLLDALYDDLEISRVLDRHHIPRRPATGHIAERLQPADRTAHGPVAGRDPRAAPRVGHPAARPPSVARATSPTCNRPSPIPRQRRCLVPAKRINPGRRLDVRLLHHERPSVARRGRNPRPRPREMDPAPGTP